MLGQGVEQNISACTVPPPDTSSESETQQNHKETSNEMIIKARPLTIRKPPLSEQPKLRNFNSNKNGISVSINRRIEMPPAFLFPEMDHLTRDCMPNELQNGLIKNDTKLQKDEVDKVNVNNSDISGSEKVEDNKDSGLSDIADQINSVDLKDDESDRSDQLRLCKKGNLRQSGKAPLTRRVSFDPLALLLDASLEGELELVKKTATQVIFYLSFHVSLACHIMFFLSFTYSLLKKIKYLSRREKSFTESKSIALGVEYIC